MLEIMIMGGMGYDDQTWDDDDHPYEFDWPGPILDSPSFPVVAPIFFITW